MSNFDKIKESIEVLAKENRVAVAAAILDQSFRNGVITENELSLLHHRLNKCDWSKCPILGSKGGKNETSNK